MIVTLVHHWQLALWAAAVGVVLGAVFVAVYYLAAPVRLRLATNPAKRTRLLHQDLGRLRRLGDAAAVSEEHGLAGAGGFRGQAELRALLLLLTAAAAPVLA